MAGDKCYAVLTGDIVKSAKLGARELAVARGVVTASLDEVRDWRRGALKGAAEFFRGDSWQALMANPSLSLRTAVFVRARLIAECGVDSRVSIGIGAVDSISRTRVSLSTGEAFLASGRALDAMGRGRLAIAAGESLNRALAPLRSWLPAFAALCDSLVSGWTPRQAEIVAAALAPSAPTQEEIARRMGVAQQAISKSLDAAHWRAIEEAIEAFEATQWRSR